MPMMVCARNYTLRSQSTGYVIEFKANVPQFVPPRCISDALAVNILYAKDEDGNDLHDQADAKAGKQRGRYELTSYMRECAILHVMHEIVQRNDANEFTGGGRPKVTVLQSELNMPSISQTEVSRLWDKYRDIVNNGNELPVPPQLRDLLEVQRASTMVDVRLYAEEYSVDIDNLSLPDARNAVMAKIARTSGDASPDINTEQLTED